MPPQVSPALVAMQAMPGHQSNTATPPTWAPNASNPDPSGPKSILLSGRRYLYHPKVSTNPPFQTQVLSPANSTYLHEKHNTTDYYQ